MVGERDGIDGVGMLEHLRDSHVYRAVGLQVEVIGLELGQRLEENVLGQNHGGQDRPFGRHILRHAHVARECDDLISVFSVARRHRSPSRTRCAHAGSCPCCLSVEAW